MKAILKFNLDEPEDREAHYRCVKSTDMALSLWDILQIYRSYKYVQLSDEQYKMLEEVNRKILDILQERDIDVDKLVS